MNLLEDPLAGGGGHGSWYHCSVKTVSRGAGRSAVAAASYRLGMELHDEKTGVIHDYTRRSGVVTTFVLAPAGAPDWAFDPEAFWNAAEAAETRINSRVAREVELALPDALTQQEREEIVRQAAQYLVDRYQVGVSAAIHAPGKHGDDRNHHAHLLFSTRRIGPDGFGAKTRELDDKARGSAEITALRQHTALLINEALERGSHDERVDWRSFQARGIAREGTKHLGPAAHQIEQKGRASRRGERNREIAANNSQVEHIVSDLAALEAELTRVQEALLDERYGALEEPALGQEAPEQPAGDAEPPVADDESKPEWFSGLTDPLPPLNAPQIEALMNRAAEPYLAQIEADGTLNDGEPEGLRWHERIARRGAELWHQARDWAQGRWQRFVANRRGPEEHRGSDIER